MAENNAHNSETLAQRLARFQNNGPIESIETLLNSIDNYFNNEIRLTPGNLQTTLLLLGVHAAALTIGEVFFASGKPDAMLKDYKQFLETFVDGDTEDTKFSLIAVDIHNWRNILAHQWLGSMGHQVEYNYQTTLGWEKKDDMLVINPKIYCDSYLKAFSEGGKIWRYDTIFTPDQLAEIHTRIVQKFESK
jgi:hypothetical protein